MKTYPNIAQIISENTLESVEVLKHLAKAHRHLGELKGTAQTIPNQAILINTLSLQEAQNSSEIENIITTQDELYKHLLSPKRHTNISAKEVANYSNALHFLYEEQGKYKMITQNMLIQAQSIIKENQAGIRQQTGTQLINEQTNEIVFTPPEPTQIQGLLTDLENFINIDRQDLKLDPLIKMAIIHHQFETIHPFYDGNGRMGRILTIAYLIQAGLLDMPILYLSRYINQNKNQYYKLLQSVREKGMWQEWLIFILKGVEEIAISTTQLISEIKVLQQEYKNIIRTQHNKIYSQELLNNIFKHPYTKIAFLQQDINATRLTASRYLDQLVKSQLLTKHKLGKENYYLNDKLIKLISSPTLF